jgi:HK97 gp10 family phage protein
MAKSGVSSRDMQRLKRSVNQHIKGIERNVSTVLRDTGQSLAESMKADAPVATGELRNSIRVDVKNAEFEISIDAEHALPVEFGTHTTRAKPFIRPNVETHTEQFKKDMRNKV